MTVYTTKDSGTHQEYASGMRRDSQDGKPRFDLIRTKLQPYEEQMITRYARLLARGAEKYSARNWEDGHGEEELERAKASLLRHTEQLIAGEEDEDHAAAVWFNAQAIEYFRWRQRVGQPDTDEAAEDALRLQRLSEINRLALKKAQQINRRVRLRAAAQEFDAELTEDARALAEQEQVSARQAMLDMEAEGRPSPRSILTELVEKMEIRDKQVGGGLFQFSNGGMPKPLSLRPTGVYSQLMSAARAEDFGRQTPPPPLTDFTMKEDGEVTDNRTGHVIVPAVTAEEDALHQADLEIKESLQLGLDRDIRNR